MTVPPAEAEWEEPAAQVMAEAGACHQVVLLIAPGPVTTEAEAAVEAKASAWPLEALVATDTQHTNLALVQWVQLK